MVVVKWIAFVWAVIDFIIFLSGVIKGEDKDSRVGYLFLAVLQGFVVYVLMAYIRKIF